jgi:hypothetical protein
MQALVELLADRALEDIADPVRHTSALPAVPRR